MRLEHDFIGELEIADDVFYGVQTFRAKQNFDITGEHLCDYPSFIYGYAKVKKACALANCELKLLDQEKCDYIVKACDEILTGKYNDQFVVDMLQGGAGTSTNMNTNEVIANVGLTMMGHNKGEYKFYIQTITSTSHSQPTTLIHQQLRLLLTTTSAPCSSLSSFCVTPLLRRQKSSRT